MSFRPLSKELYLANYKRERPLDEKHVASATDPEIRARWERALALRDEGARLVLGDEIVDEIVACGAHDRKASIAALWDRANAKLLSARQVSASSDPHGWDAAFARQRDATEAGGTPPTSVDTNNKSSY